MPGIAMARGGEGETPRGEVAPSIWPIGLPGWGWAFLLLILWLFLGTSREGLAWGGWGWGVWGEVEGREVPLGWEEGGFL